MFEVKKTKDETLFIGNWIDILHFGEVFSKIYKEQREMISYGSFCGTLDEYALHLGYSSPASSLFRKRLEELEKIGIAEIVPYSEEFFKEHKNEFTWYVDENNRGKRCIMIKDKNEIIPILMKLEDKDLPRAEHPIKKKGVDKRNENNEKRLHDSRITQENIDLVKNLIMGYRNSKLSDTMNFEEYIRYMMPKKKAEILLYVNEHMKD